MPLKAVVFDLYGTLVPVFPGGETRTDIPAMARELDLDLELLRRGWKAVKDRDLGLTGSVEGDIREALAAVGVTPEEESLRRAVATRLAFMRGTLVPRVDAVSTLQRLREAGLRLALVSNASVEVPALFAETPLAPLLDPQVFSCREHRLKPDPRIFEKALDGLGLAGEECAFVGDGYGNELTGSSAVGMRAILIDVPDEPHLDIPEYEGGSWTGERVAALSELPPLLGC